MLRSVHPSDRNARRLQDPRLDDRFSQFSDTPSVYSPAHFSPRPLDAEYDYGLATSRNPLNDPNISTLDFDDDPRSSVANSDIYEQHDDDDDDTRSFEDPHHGEPLDDHRLSYLGPTMRFHSRAPWEMDGGGILEEESVLPDSPKHHMFPFHLSRTAQSTHASGPCPPQSVTSRPSGESFRSHLMPKRSFDTINSQLSSKGALYALAQESLSSASLVKASPSTQKESLLGKLSSLGRGRGPNANHSSPSSPITSPHRLPLNPRIPLVPRNHLDKRTLSDYETHSSSNRNRFTTDVTSSSPQEESVHPYANPDLILVTDESEFDTNFASNTHGPSPIRNDSSVTVTQKFTSDSASYAASRTSLSSSYSSSLVPPAPGGRKRISSVQGREISSPVAVQGTSLPPENHDGQPPGVANLTGWTEKFVPPAFNLISLEEARAQRTRNSALGEDSAPSISNLLSQSTTTLNNDDALSIAHGSSAGTRARGRTISTGAKAKNVFQSMVGSVMAERRDSEPAVLFSLSQSQPVSQPKTLKHKKSGFMRIFNGGRDKDLDEPPLPVPSTSDMHGSKKSTGRVPVPALPLQPPYDLAPGLEKLPNATSIPTTSIDTDGPRRAPPTLHINTVSPALQPRGLPPDRNYQQRTMTSLFASDVPKPWNTDSYPQSAPADVTGFPALKLRPVSGLFSSHFEHMVPDFQASSQSGMETPVSSSPTGLISPITPANDRFSKPDVDDQAVDAKSLGVTSSQRRIGELEGQLRSLKAELHELRSKQQQFQDDAYCSACGRGRNYSPPTHDGSMSSASSSSSSSGNSVVNRPRAKTGTGATSRFVNALA